MYDIGIAITTSAREIPTLKASVNSLRKCLSWQLYIFAEPCPLELNSYALTIFQHRSKLGAFKNFDFALRWLLNNTDKNTLVMLQDDYIYSSLLTQKLIEISESKQSYGYYSLYTNKYNSMVMKGITSDGWNRIDLGFNDAWNVAYVINRSVAKILVEHPFYQEKMEKHNRIIDGTVSEVMLKLGLPMYYHNPSLACSIGYSSTLNNRMETNGLNFKI